MKLGYSYFGFQADTKYDEHMNVLSTPDGNATYTFSIFYEAQRRGWHTVMMMPDRDEPGYGAHHEKLFSSFSQEKRLYAYANAWRGIRFPDLDVLLVEWRFPIDGRNSGKKVLQHDLRLQDEMLWHYREHSPKTRIVAWDLDHKLTIEDEKKWQFDAVFETSVNPRHLYTWRTRVEPPIIVSDLMQHPTLPCDPKRKLVYVGSRYERDDVIDEWIKPISEMYPQEVEFYGNWLMPYNVGECRKRWPNVKLCDRIGVSGFRDAYGTAVACPLLSKRSYQTSGFITPRVWEALLFGTIPVGFAGHAGINQYVDFVADDVMHFDDILMRLSSMDVKQRDELRRKNIEKIEFMDVKHFIDTIEKVAA